MPALPQGRVWPLATRGLQGREIQGRVLLPRLRARAELSEASPIGGGLLLLESQDLTCQRLYIAPVDSEHARKG